MTIQCLFHNDYCANILFKDETQRILSKAMQVQRSRNNSQYFAYFTHSLRIVISKTRKTNKKMDYHCCHGHFTMQLLTLWLYQKIEPISVIGGRQKSGADTQILSEWKSSIFVGDNRGYIKLDTQFKILSWFGHRNACSK